MIVAIEKKGDRVIVLAPDLLSKPMMREDGTWRTAAFSAETLVTDYDRVFGVEAEVLFMEAKIALEAIQKPEPKKAITPGMVSIERYGDRAEVLAPEHLPVPLIRENGIWKVGIYEAGELGAYFRVPSDEEKEAIFQEAVAAFWRNKERIMAEKKAKDAAYKEWKKTKSTEFTVYIDDNFHPMSGDGRITGPTFSTLEEAEAECKRIVDRSLRWLRFELVAIWDKPEPLKDPEALYKRYTAFGDDPFIRANGPDNPGFRAWAYAEERCKDIVKEDINDKTLYDFDGGKKHG